MTILAEELHVIALDDNGAIGTYANLNIGSIGAILLDLAIAERIDLVDKKVVVTNPEPTGHPLLDDVLRKMETGKPRTPRSWNNQLYWGQSKQVLETMVERGIVQREKRKLLGLLPSTRHLPVNPMLREDIRRRLAAAADAGKAPDAATAALAGLTHALGMEKFALPGRPAGPAKKALKTVADQSWASDATRQAIQATQTALMLTVSASLTATTADSGGGS